VPAHHLDEHQLAELGQHTLATGAFLPRLLHGKLDEGRKSSTVVPLRHHHRRKGLEQGVEGLRVAGEETAHNVARGTVVASQVKNERQLPFARLLHWAAHGGIRAHSRFAG